MIRRESPGVADRFVKMFQLVTGGQLYDFLSYLNRFVYGFYVIWNSNSGRVWLLLFEQDINRPQGLVMRYLSINQTHVFTHIPASTFSTTLSYFFLFITSSQEFVDLSSARSQVPREYLLAVTSGRIAVVRTKVFELPPLPIERSNRLARLNV